MFIGLIAVNANPLDSIGITTVNGKTFIQYKVERGESVYSIAKKYNVTIQDIIDNNPEIANGLKADAVILVPYTPPEENKVTHHIVLSGETLFKIATEHNITVSQLRKWNNLKNDNINIGQRLRVIPPERIEPVQPPVEPKPKPQPPVEVKDTTPAINTKQDEVDVMAVDTTGAIQKEYERQLKLEQEAKERARMDSIAQALAPKEFDADAQMDTVLNVEDVDLVDIDYTSNRTKLPSGEIIDNGGCELIENKEVNQDRNVCYHPDAPVGTIIMVTNPDNNRSVFVRVIGNYEPQVGNYVIIRVTRETAKRLGATGNYFKVNLSYSE